MSHPVANSGVKTRLIGVVLVFLGVLDSMLSWRGGFALSHWYVFLIGSGLFLYALGAIRKTSKLLTARNNIPRSGSVEGGSP